MRINGFSEGLSLLAILIFLVKIKKYLNKNQYFMSNFNVRELDPPTHLRQFDANYGNIQYVCEP